MRWFKRRKVEPVETPAEPVWNLNKMYDAFENRGIKVVLGPVNFGGEVIPVLPIPMMVDPHNIRPMFDMRYENVKIGPDYISLRAARHNVGVFKLRAKEVVTDPKRVARRHWHHYMSAKRRQRMIDDSFLFM